MAKKKFSSRLRKLIFNDRYLIVVSLLLAVVVWIITSINIGDDIEKSIKIEAPINLGDEVSEQLSMQYYSLQDKVEINVTLTGKKYVIGQVNEKDFKVSFDTSAVRKTGEQNIPIVVSNNSNLDFAIKSIYPSTIDAYFDVNMTKTFDLNLDIGDGYVADGYMFGDPILSEDKVLISGPKSSIEKIDEAVLSVDFGDKKDIKEPYKTECLIELKGSELNDANYLTITSRTDTKTPIEKIAVTIPVLKRVTLPVSADFEDKPDGVDEGMVSIDYSPDTIEAGVLESANISEAVIGTINFNKITVGKQTMDFDVSKLKGITLTDKKLKTIKVTVDVSTSYSIKTIAIRRSDVLVEGLSDKQKANVRNLDKYYVTVIMPNDIPATDIELELKVDVSEKSDDNVYPLSVSITNNDNAWVYSDYHATVDIT